MSSSQQSLAKRFQEQNRVGNLLLPNAWDAASARIFEIADRISRAIGMKVRYVNVAPAERRPPCSMPARPHTWPMHSMNRPTSAAGAPSRKSI
jgi:hypothetical protein